MKKILSVIFLLVVIVTVSHAERSVTGFTSFNQYREVGEYRYWTFVVKDSDIGTLISTVKKQVTINGIAGYEIEQRLQLDYSKISTDLKFDILNLHYVADNGMYLGDKMKITINDLTEEAELERDGTILNGYITRSGTKIDQKIDLGNIIFTVENNYIDDLELFLASLDLTVGTVIDDTIFMAQSLIESQIYGVVEDFRNVSLYNEVIDSVFIIEFSYPTMMTAYFTPEKRLVKLILPSQELKVYQDAVANPLKAKLSEQKTAEQIKKKTIQRPIDKPIGQLIILYLLYLVIGAMVTFFFIKSFYKKSILNIFVLAGGGLFVIVPFTQIPMQEYLFTEYFIPHVLKAGESALLWGLLPAATAGVIQELVKCFALIIAIKFLKNKKISFISLGAVIGLGFGLVEAMYLTYGTPSTLFLGVNLVERFFMIAFHISAGVFIGYALKKGTSKVVSYLLLTVLLNSIFRYLPIFAQNKSLTPELLGIVLAFISVIFVIIVLFVTKRES